MCKAAGGFGQCALQHAPRAPDRAQGGLQPQPASANWQACSGWPALPALLSHREARLQLLVDVGHVDTEADEGESGDTDVEDVAALPPEGAALPHHSKRGVSHEACTRRQDTPLRPLLPLPCTA